MATAAREIRVPCSAAAAERCSTEVASVPDSGCDVDRRLVELELDAALALTDFAHLASLERERSGEGGRKWGSRGRRSEKRRRVRSEVCGVEWGRNLGGFRSKSKDSTVDGRQRRKRVRKVVPTKIVKSEQDLKLPKTEQHHDMCIATPQGSISCGSSGGSRSKHQLTETEKEAKRLRRILANRESARQTIRRRQAMCDDMAKKAADLALEKKSLKQEKELIMKEFQLLLDKNNDLKMQIARSLNVQEQSTTVKVVPTTSASIKQEPLPVCNSEQVTPFIWSPIQSIKEQPLVHDPVVPRIKLESSDKQGNVQSTHQSGPPLYIMPCPWFFPLGNRFYPHQMDSFSLINKQNGVFVNSFDEGSSLNIPETSTKVVRDAKSSSNLPGGGNHLGSYTSGMNQTPIFLRSFGPTVVVKPENSFFHDSTSREGSGSSTTIHTANPYPEHLKAHYIYHTKKMVNAAMAAEARRRRKELTRLKNLNGRQQRLHC